MDQPKGYVALDTKQLYEAELRLTLRQGFGGHSGRWGAELPLWPTAYWSPPPLCGKLQPAEVTPLDHNSPNSQKQQLSRCKSVPEAQWEMCLDHSCLASQAP